MRRTLIIGPDAEDDLRAAMAWYAQRSAGLDQRFLQEFNEHCQVIKAVPMGAPVLRGPIRMLPMRVFDHVITFSVEPDRIFILRVVHGRRHPKQRRTGRRT